jgi:ABC-2 type transport system ATP-binding protein
MKDAAIEVRHLVKSYKGAATRAVNNISFTIEKGEIWGLLGPNGAGKTTTISILCGLMKQTSGEVLIHGITHENKSAEIKQLISMVPQDIALYPSLTATENLNYVGSMYGLKGKMLRDRIAECLYVFGLTDVANKRVETFSGGMKRRINLIAGILHEPKIVFLDEPTAGVDVQSRNMITGFLLELNKKGTTIVYTSHLMEEVSNLCTHIAVIDHGTIIASGEPAGLIQQYQCMNLEELFLKLTGRQLRD